MKTHFLQKNISAFLGPDSTKSEKIIVSFCIILFPTIIPLYSLYAELNWSLLQLVIAYGIAFDIMSGCIVYNSFEHKQIRFGEKQISGYIKHALLHMQPLVVASFFTEHLLLYIGLYWFLMYVVFVSLFEPVSKVSRKIENIINGTFISINLFFLFLCFAMISDQSMLLYGAFNYIILAPLTIIQLYLPIRSQRLYGTSIVVVMSIINMMLLNAPDGFQWFMPVLYVKLFMGYNARENISLEV